MPGSETKSVSVVKKICLFSLIFLAGLLSIPVHIAAAADNFTQQFEYTRHASANEKLQAVNSYFNKLSAVSDIRQWKKVDYWATPEELMSAGGGDCEDFAVAKYFSLLELGIDTRQLKLMYVERQIRQGKKSEAHMVLIYRDEKGTDLVLDNINKSIVPLSHRSDLKPVYSFNSEDVWLWSETSGDLYYGKAAQLVQWRSLLSRLAVRPS